MVDGGHADPCPVNGEVMPESWLPKVEPLMLKADLDRDSLSAQVAWTCSGAWKGKDQY